MIDSPAGDDLAELTSLSRSGRLARPLAGAGGLAALSVSCNPVKELLPLPLTGRSPKASAKVRTFPDMAKYKTHFFLIKTWILTSFH